jgi:hypothetical protein
MNFCSTGERRAVAVDRGVVSIISVLTEITE